MLLVNYFNINLGIFHFLETRINFNSAIEFTCFNSFKIFLNVIKLTMYYNRVNWISHRCYTFP